MSHITELFKQRTSIDADYFLLEVLRVMGEYEDEDSLSSSGSSTTIAMHRYSVDVAVIRTTETSMTIQRLPHVSYGSAFAAQQDSGSQGNSTSSEEGDEV